MILNLGNDKVGRVAALTLFDVHSLGECLPHTVLPLQVVLLHALVVITFSALTHTDGTHLLEVVVDVARNEVVVLVRLVTETEDHIFEALELMLAVRELEGLVREVLTELNGVVRGLSLTVGGHDEKDAAVVGDLVEILEVVLLGVAHERRETELGLGFLCKADRIFLRGTCLRAVEDDDALLL